ncbi:hypothetical protein NBRC116188_14580 [Oceaniserpentilla sp. 4NH20-0058]|uniref:hypothetical protein n=1 Tax=Oceaniserpentilla sp. 4NH20-0058 TaxID=3127660 RepID=UPI003109AF0C
MVGVALYEDKVTLCHGIYKGSDLEIISLENRVVPTVEQLSYVKSWVTQHKLKNADCYVVLDQDEYELELIECPPVEEDELPEAVRWRLKDLINLPIEDAAIDIFHLPDDAYRGRMKMLYVVAASKTLIEKKIQFIKDCGLDLKIIDIEELALRNLSLLMPEAEQGTVAFISLKENNGQIHMFSHEGMYLTRLIEMGYSSFIAQDTTELQIQNESQDVMVERFVLDIQRSLDYYESQVGKGIANKIYILPSELIDIDIREHLQRSLEQNVINYDCKEFLSFSGELELEKCKNSDCLHVIGTLLRRGSYATG